MDFKAFLNGLLKSLEDSGLFVVKWGFQSSLQEGLASCIFIPVYEKVSTAERYDSLHADTLIKAQSIDKFLSLLHKEYPFANRVLPMELWGLNVDDEFRGMVYFTSGTKLTIKIIAEVKELIFKAQN